jgi:Flp pilus assembly protein TadG
MSRHDDGNTSVEMVLLLPVFMLLIVGGLEMARGATLRMALGDGTWRAVRFLSVYDPWDEAEAKTIVQDAVSHNVLGGDPSSVTLTVSDDGGRGFGSVITIRAEAVFCPVVPFLTGGCLTLESEHSQQIEVWP